MNNRIKELYHEAATWCEQNAQGTPVAWEWEEKFAELILRDIDKIIDELYHALPLEQAAVLLTLDENIKEHFYVTENERQD